MRRNARGPNNPFAVVRLGAAPRKISGQGRRDCAGQGSCARRPRLYRYEFGAVCMASDATYSQTPSYGGVNVRGLFWLAVASLAAGWFFIDGLDALLAAWQLPEYSHGPLIPVLSALLFLRQLKDVPVDPGPKRDRWVGVTVVFAAIALGTLGKLSNIDDLVAYATILWVGGILLVSFGWKTGKHFWPPVLHLVYMLPLPGVIYYNLSTSLQMVSSEFGVCIRQLMSVPVFLDGNIIDLGVMKLHVAEACSGLRYLFPIMSFSYIFAVLYQGPMWHKAVLLIAAAPITVAMNSVRIAVAGYIVNEYGVSWSTASPISSKAGSSSSPACSCCSCSRASCCSSAATGSASSTLSTSIPTGWEPRPCGCAWFGRPAR